MTVDARLENTAMNETPHSSLANRRSTILLVDDNPRVLLALQEALLPAGYDCRGCHEPSTAMSTILALTPDLVIIDVQFGEQGQTLHEEIQADERLTAVAVMLLSGGQSADVVRRRGSHGAAYCLRKPFDARLLLDLVDKVLWMPHLASSHQRQRAGESGQGLGIGLVDVAPTGAPSLIQ